MMQPWDSLKVGGMNRFGNNTQHRQCACNMVVRSSYQLVKKYNQNGTFPADFIGVLWIFPKFA